MRVLYNLITYLFFPGTLAVAGYGVIELYFTSHNPWHYWPVLLFSYMLLPVAGLILLIKLGYLKDLHVYDQAKRNLSYPMALLGTIIAWSYLKSVLNMGLPSGIITLRWAYAINFTILGIWILNRVWIKISAHMAGSGGFAALMVYLVHRGSIPQNWVVIGTILLVLIYMARRGLSAHSHIELLVGSALGFITTFAVLML